MKSEKESKRKKVSIRELIDRWRKAESGKRRIFNSYLDNFFYLILSALYPIIAYNTDISTVVVNNKASICSYLLTAVLFTGNYFYDFYCRYKACDGKGYSVIAVKQLAWGRRIFAGLVIFTVVMLFSCLGNWLELKEIKWVMWFVGAWGLYPIAVALYELVMRSRIEEEKKLNAARV